MLMEWQRVQGSATSFWRPSTLPIEGMWHSYHHLHVCVAQLLVLQQRVALLGL
jgi:hypothetical protein